MNPKGQLKIKNKNMKKFTNSLKALPLLLLLLSAKNSSAQCSANFTYAVNANGNVTFSSTSIPGNSISTVYYWTYGNGSPTFTATGSAGMFPSTTYTANGNYVVNLFILSSAPSCSSGISYTINVNTVSSGTCNLVANFGISQGANGLVNFNNTSTGTFTGTTYSWNFGNGNSSTSTSPSTTYSVNGTYIATLTANNNFTPSCISTKTVSFSVNSNCNLNTAFNVNISSNGNVVFSNLTTPSVGVTYTWSFGNGGNSNAVNPNFTYTSNGSYTVNLTAQSFSPSCNSSTIAVITITNVTGCNLNANFSASQGSTGIVNFNNTSTGTSSTTVYSWNFGNGVSSNLSSPIITYTSNGSYTVTLTASNNSTPTCVSTKTTVVFVNSICNLVAGFTYSAGNNGLVNFFNTTTNTNSFVTYSWNFGSAPSSSATNPSYAFANGTYTVTLTATSFSPNCVNSVSQVIAVTNNTCIANSNFTLIPTSTPKLWNAIPAASANITAAQWSWGDGSVSNTLYTSHLYSVSATYTICLSTTVSCGASSTYCSSYFVYKGNGQSSDMIEVNVLDPSNTVGIKAGPINESQINIYPNPSNGLFNLHINGITDGVLKLELYNLIGELLLESSAFVKGEELTKNIDLQEFSNGIYLIKVSTNGQSVIKKVTIQK